MSQQEIDRQIEEYTIINPFANKVEVRKILKKQIKANALQETLPFRYNQDIKYKAGPLTSSARLYDGLIKQDKQVTMNGSFRASFTDVFEKYIKVYTPLIMVETEAYINLWKNNPIQF